MVRSTQNNSMQDVVKPTQEKLSGAQQKQVSNVIMNRMSQQIKAKSVNSVLMEINKEKKD